MRTEHYLFHILGVTSESRVSLLTVKAAGSLLLIVLRW